MADLVSLLVDPSRAAEHTDSRRVFGAHTGVYSLDAGVNSWMPRLGFRGLVREWESEGQCPAFVHYASIDVPPLATGAEEVVSIHDSPRAYASTGLYRARRRYRWTLAHRRRTYRRFSHVMAQSEYVRSELEADGFDAAIGVVPTAPDPIFRPSEKRSETRARLGLPIDTPLVLSVSTDEPRKNLATVRAVGERLAGTARLVRVGPPLPGAINLPRLSDVDLAALYAAADALLLPSLEEGLGLPVIEAFASGLPVVASRIPALEEVALDAAVLADPLDVRGLAAGVRDVLGDPTSWRDRGLRRAERFAWPRFRERLVAYYATIGFSLPRPPDPRAVNA